MKEKLKRSLGLLLALVMVASMFPVSVFAEEAEPISTEDVSVIVADEEASVVEQVTSFVSNVIGPLQLEEETAEEEPEPLTATYKSLVDGNEYQDGQPVVVNDGKADPDVNLNDNNHNQEQSMKTIQLDGVDYQADEKVIEALQAAQNDAAEKLDEIHTLLSAVDEKDSQIADLQEKLDTANNEIDESVIDAAVNAKLEILDAARAAGIECDTSDDVSDLKRKVIAAAFDSIDLESIEDEASINALYMSANKVIADRAEEQADGCKDGKGKGGTKKNPAAQFDGARGNGAQDDNMNDSAEDRLLKRTIEQSLGKKKEA